MPGPSPATSPPPSTDTTSSSAVAGRFALTDGDARHLRDVLGAHEQSEHLVHIRRSLVVQGDVRNTLPRYLVDNPHTVIALAHFVLDLYKPTRHTVDAIRPYLTTGSVLAFDELAHAKWPGRHRSPARHPRRRPRRCSVAPHPPTCGGTANGPLLSRPRPLPPAAHVDAVQLVAAPRRVAELGAETVDQDRPRRASSHCHRQLLRHATQAYGPPLRPITAVARSKTVRHNGKDWHSTLSRT